MYITYVCCTPYQERKIKMISLGELSGQSIVTLGAILGAPFMTAYSFIQIQLSSLKSDINSKASKENLESEVEGIRESVTVKQESFDIRLDNLEISMSKVESKLDKVIDILIKGGYGKE